MQSPVKIRVMVIDDEQHAYLLVNDLLRSINDRFQVDWALDYEEGLAAFQQDKHDVYILDYMLVDREGIELLEEVRQFNTHSPIIMVTGHGTHEVDMLAMQLGAQDYFEKTELNPKLLERSIRYAIESKRAKAELQQAYEQISELEQLKTDMIQLAAHDMSSPITAMMGLSEMLLDDLEQGNSSNAIDYLENIHTSARKMRKIISDILSLERIEYMHKGGMHAVDFCSIVMTAFDEYSLPAQHKDQVLTSDIINEKVLVAGNDSQLKEAVYNLIQNALKYTPPGGTIHVSLHADATKATYMVQDNGYGIEEAKQERLFKPFYRALSQETRTIEGTGLGLHLVQKIIHRHKGSIIFESTYGEGSTFGFDIPLLEQESSVAS